MIEYDVFTAALKEADPARRAAFLDQACSDDPKRRRRIEVLLKAHELAEGFLEEPAPVPEPSDAITEGLSPDSPPAQFTAEGPGTRVGPYKLLQEIGQGGMGTVFLAEQDRPVRRKVALKVIKAGMDSAQVVARFEAERQALALMDHPNIAKVFDAGATESGRPFFVMELVKGIPLTNYCDDHRLDLPARLALFRQICSAVQHAHQKGIIHRDLKPTNILVESHDGNPVPKVIDFGLAKATSGLQLGEHTLYSAFGSVAGTPLYMAPEQALFNALDVDTRADIYALGVILYELLTGSTPIERETFKRAALEEMLRIIREVDPPTPSSRLSSSEALPSIAASRHVEPARLSRTVRGDLDWIVMKALAKERHRRYDSAMALANDIERFTNDEPVSAGPPTASYRFKKFVRRNRGRVIAASLVLLALVGGVVGTSFGLIVARQQTREARRQERMAIEAANEKEKARQAEAEQRKEAMAQRERAEKRLTQIEKANEILGSIFNDLNPANAEREGKTLIELLAEHLDQATAQIEGDAIGDPLAVARMQMTLGESQLGLGYPKKSIALLSKARATLTTVLGPDHADTLRSMSDLAYGYIEDNDRKRGFTMLEEALALQRAKLGPDHELTLTNMGNFASQDVLSGNWARGLPMLEETLALMKAKLGPDHPSTLAAMSQLANSYRFVGQVDRAVPLLEQTLALEKAKLGPEHHHTLHTIHMLAICFQATGKFDRALPLYEQAFNAAKTKFGLDHPVTLSFMGSLSSCYGSVGDFDRALPMAEQTLALQKIKIGPDHPDTLLTMDGLACMYQTAGKLDRALPLFEETDALMKAKLGPDHAFTLKNMNDLALAYNAAGKLERSLKTLHELTDLWKQKGGADSPIYAGVLVQLGRVQLEAKKWIEAELPLREGLAIRESKEPDKWTTFNTKSLLGGALLGQKKYEQAEPLIIAGYEGLKARESKVPKNAKAQVADARDRVIALYESWDKPEKAAEWRTRLMKPTH